MLWQGFIVGRCIAQPDEVPPATRERIANAYALLAFEVVSEAGTHINSTSSVADASGPPKLIRKEIEPSTAQPQS